MKFPRMVQMKELDTVLFGPYTQPPMCYIAVVGYLSGTKSPTSLFGFILRQ